MSRLTANLLMLIAAIVWGAAFVAQSTAMDSMGPFGFTGIRFILASLAVAPFALYEYRRSPLRLSRGVMVNACLVGVVFFIAMVTQQFGFHTTSVTNAGFLTALYVVLTPIMGFILFRSLPSPFVWPIVALSLTGAYCLAGSLETMNEGDILMMVSALFWALQIIFLGRLVITHGNPLMIAMLQFLTCGILGLLFGFSQETIAVPNLQGAWFEIIYTGVFSGGLAFSLQAVAQRHTPASDAAILLSSESLFAALFGALLLGERLTAKQMVGCTLIFSCILLVELLPHLQRRFRRLREARNARLAT